jgi:mono/diheme cytochrome c family protein
MIGCTGLIDDGGTGGLTPEQAKARRLWLDKALPQFTTNCQVCHDGSRVNIGFVEGTSDLGRRDTLMAYAPAVVNVDAPGSSRILTKGLHEGPALDAIQTSDILEWVQAERDAQPDPGAGGPVLETEPFLAQICTGGLPGEATCPINTVGLDAIGDGVVGAKIQFVAQALGSGIYMTNLRLLPGAGGAFIEHPLFVSWPEDTTMPPKADTIDRFFNVKLNLMMTASPEEEQIGGGTAAFVGFVATDKLTIHFKTAKLYQPDGGGGPGGGASGCKVLASFKTNAQTLFSQPVAGAGQSCLSCHGGQNPNATSAMNLTGVDAADDPTIQLACNQVRTRVNFQSPDQSSIFLAPDPANMNHPFKFNAAQLGTFRAGPPGAGNNKWIADEVVAP